MTMMKTLVQQGLLSVANALSRNCSYRLLDEIRDIPRWSEEDVRRYQREKLAKLVRHCYDNVPYYRRVFGGLGLTPEDIKSPEDLKRLPVLDKSVIVANKADLIARTYAEKDLVKSSTGGSSGDPLNFYRDKDYIALGQAGLLRAMETTGWRPGEMFAYFWGCGADYYRKSKAGLLVRAHLKRFYHFDAFNTSEEELQEWIGLFRRLRPTLISGYASTVHHFARYVRRNGIAIPALKGVVTTAETLFPSQRATIEEALGCKVFDFYGSCEILSIASECSFHRMHVASDFVVPEEEPGEGEESRSLIFTSLHNYGMPFLRYRNGDCGRLLPDRCECGSPFPLLDLQIARVGDVFQMPNGNVVSGHYFEYVLYGVEGIKSFQFQQTSRRSIVIRYVKDGGFGQHTAKGIENVVQALKEKGGTELEVSVACVDDIPLTQQGKHVYLIPFREEAPRQ